MKVIYGYKRCVYEITGVNSIRILVESIDEINPPLPFVKPFVLTSGVSVRSPFQKEYKSYFSRS